MVFSFVSGSRQSFCIPPEQGWGKNVCQSPVHNKKNLQQCEFQERRGERERGLTISLIILAASPTEVAWNPIDAMLSTNSAAVMSLSLKALKSTPLTFSTPSGTGSEAWRTAPWAMSGTPVMFPWAMLVGCVCVCVCVYRV